MSTVCLTPFIECKQRFWLLASCRLLAQVLQYWRSFVLISVAFGRSSMVASLKKLDIFKREWMPRLHWRRVVKTRLRRIVKFFLVETCGVRAAFMWQLSCFNFFFARSLKNWHVMQMKVFFLQAAVIWAHVANQHRQCEEGKYPSKRCKTVKSSTVSECLSQMTRTCFASNGQFSRAVSPLSAFCTQLGHCTKSRQWFWVCRFLFGLLENSMRRILLV